MESITQGIPLVTKHTPNDVSQAKITKKKIIGNEKYYYMKGNKQIRTAYMRNNKRRRELHPLLTKSVIALAKCKHMTKLHMD